MQDFLDQITELRNSASVMAFVEHNLLLLTFVFLAFGFAALLIEIRLPLKYYWDLPAFFLRPFLEAVGIVKKIPVWGRCLDSRTNLPISVAAVELLEKEKLKTIKATFTDRLGVYGFNVKPGKYVVRAVKNNYIAPPFFDPENIQLKSVDESLALPVEVTSRTWPTLNLMVQPASTVTATSFWQSVMFYVRAFSINLANGLLILAVINSWYGWVVTRNAVFGVLLAVSIIFVFIKLYILEAVGTASKHSHA